MNNFLFPLSFLLLLLHSTTTLAQAPAPGPSGPTNVTKILEKAGQYTTFIRLLKITQEGDQINTQLNNSNQGLTIFAPTDNAFSALKAGTLNSLSDQQKVQLIQFHIIPNFLSTSQFQTISNPLRTQAGNSDAGEFPLNVTTSGNQVINDRSMKLRLEEEDHRLWLKIKSNGWLLHQMCAHNLLFSSNPNLRWIKNRYKKLNSKASVFW